MTVHLIRYAPSPADGPNPGLAEAVRSVGPGWWQGFESTWLVMTSKTTAQIRDELAPHLRRNDRLMVVTCGAGVAWSGFGDTQAYWLAESFSLPSPIRASV